MSVDATVYRLALRDLLRSRKALFSLLVSLVPMVLAILAVVDMTYMDHWQPLTIQGALFIGLPATIPIVCLILAGGLIADEAEDRTLSYLLVRPLRRRTLYTSRGLAVLTVAVALALFQGLSTWLVDAVAFMSHDMAGRTLVADGGEVSAGAILGISLPLVLLLAALAAVVYTAMFGAGSVIFPRYHFFANLVFFLVWEIGIGFVPVATAWLSANHGLRAVAGAADPTVFTATAVEGVWGWLGLLPVLAWIVVWMLVGQRVMERRDFHVTSAAT